jgi:hypothetical protein
VAVWSAQPAWIDQYESSETQCAHSYWWVFIKRPSLCHSCFFFLMFSISHDPIQLWFGLNHMTWFGLVWMLSFGGKLELTCFKMTVDCYSGKEIVKRKHLVWRVPSVSANALTTFWAVRCWGSGTKLKLSSPLREAIIPGCKSFVFALWTACVLLVRWPTP